MHLPLIYGPVLLFRYIYDHLYLQNPAQYLRHHWHLERKNNFYCYCFLIISFFIEGILTFSTIVGTNYRPELDLIESGTPSFSQQLHN